MAAVGGITKGDSTPSGAAVQISNVSKSFTRKTRGNAEALNVLNNISLDIASGQFVTLIGHSGCGKTTLLNCIAGLTEFDEGRITLDGNEITGPGPDRAIVFQHASLLPWRTILSNVCYGLELRRMYTRAEILDRANAAIELVGLGGHASDYPHEISGGMQQRVNLARALAVEPDLVLMDEPFGALDAMTKEVLQDELSALASRAKRTTVFVTHDIHEAVYLADKVVVMSPNPGRISAQIDVPFARPRSRELTETEPFTRIVAELRALVKG